MVKRFFAFLLFVLSIISITACSENHAKPISGDNMVEPNATSQDSADDREANKKWRITTSVVDAYYPDNTTSHEATDYTYDASGNLITEETVYDGNYVFPGIKTATLVYTYDDDGNALTKQYSVNGNERYIANYKYSEDGMSMTEEKVFSDGNTSTITCTYDANGNVLTKEETDIYGRLEHATMTYDDYGNVLTATYVEPGDVRETSHAYVYDDSGNVLTETYFAKGKIKRISTYTYNDRGRVLTEDIERADNVSGDGQEHVEYTYDENGNEISRTNTCEGFMDITPSCVSVRNYWEEIPN